MIQTKARNEDLYKFQKLLKKQQHAKHDMVVPSHSVRMSEDGTFAVEDAPIPSNLENLLKAEGITPNGETPRSSLPYEATNHAHGQLVSRLPIPAWKRAYDFLREDEPQKLSELVNLYLGKIEKNLLVRTFRPEDEFSGERGLIRSFLSSKYSMMENFDIFFTAMRTLKQLGEDGGFRPKVSCNLSNRSMWCSFTVPDLAVDAADFMEDYSNPHPDGDPSGGIPSKRVVPGFIIRNSEVGAATFSITPRLQVQVCSNGIVRSKDASEKRHVGSRMNSGVVEYGEEVRQKALELADAEVREAVGHFVSEDYIHETIEDIYGDGADKTLEHPREALSNACQEIGLTQEEEEEVLGFFHRGRSERRHAVPNAISAYSQHVDDPDRALEIQADAWDVLPEMERLDAPEDDSR